MLLVWRGWERRLAARRVMRRPPRTASSRCALPARIWRGPAAPSD